MSPSYAKSKTVNDIFDDVYKKKNIKEIHAHVLISLYLSVHKKNIFLLRSCMRKNGIARVRLSRARSPRARGELHGQLVAPVLGREGRDVLYDELGERAVGIILVRDVQAEEHQGLVYRCCCCRPAVFWDVVPPVGVAAAAMRRLLLLQTHPRIGALCHREHRDNFAATTIAAVLIRGGGNVCHDIVREYLLGSEGQRCGKQLGCGVRVTAAADLLLLMLSDCRQEVADVGPVVGPRLSDGAADYR